MLHPSWTNEPEAEKPRPPSELVIEADALDAFHFFAKVGDQWRYSPTGIILGLDLTAVILTLKINIQSKKKRKRLLNDVQCIAQGVREAMEAEREADEIQ